MRYNMIFDVFPLFNLLRREHQKIHGDKIVTENTSQAGHFPSAASLSIERTIFNDEKIKVGIGTSRSACLGPEKYDLARFCFPYKNVSQFLQ